MEIESASRVRSPASPDVDQEQSQRDELVLLVRVKAASSDGAEIEIVYERAKSSIRTSDGEFSADSGAPSASTTSRKPGTNTPPSQTSPTSKPAPGSKPATPTKPTATPPGSQPATTPALPDIDPLAALDPAVLLQQHVESVAGTVLKVALDPAGNIVKVEGGESLSGAGLSGLGGLSGLSGKGGLSPGAVANWVVGGLGGGAGSGTPDRVRVGQSWTTRSSLAGTPIGSFSMSTRYTLEAAASDMARVAFKGQMEAPSESAVPGGGFGGMQVRSAGYAGSAQWDTRRGELASVAATTDVRLGGQAADTTMEMTSKQQVRVTRVP